MLGCYAQIVGGRSNMIYMIFNFRFILSARGKLYSIQFVYQHSTEPIWGIIYVCSTNLWGFTFQNVALGGHSHKIQFYFLKHKVQRSGTERNSRSGDAFLNWTSLNLSTVFLECCVKHKKMWRTSAVFKHVSLVHVYINNYRKSVRWNKNVVWVPFLFVKNKD